MIANICSHCTLGLTPSRGLCNTRFLQPTTLREKSILIWRTVNTNTQNLIKYVLFNYTRS